MSVRHALLWNLATIIIAVAVSVFVVNREIDPVDHHHHHSHAQEADFHQWIHDNLNLTEEQSRILHPIEDVFENNRKTHRNEILRAGRELAEAIGQSPADEGALDQALQKLHRAQGELQKATLQHFLEMKDHLTDEQGQKLIQWTRDSILHGYDD
ncbi:MAG: periplasmic heavy metal sensor [Verrucomicrobiales bacterium]|nr:periplasmic heavy metal sensor [Verrucomicrobiales bacterium]